MNDRITERRDVVSILRTIHLFLESHDFRKTAKKLRRECDERDLEDVYQPEEASKFRKNVPSNQAVCAKSVHITDKNLISPESSELGPQSSYTTIFKNITDNCYVSERVIVEPSKERSEEANDGREEKLNSCYSGEPSTFIKCDCGDELKKKFEELQNDHQRLMKIAGQLLVAVQLNLRGQTRSLTELVKKCENIYPELFPKSVSSALDAQTSVRSILKKNVGLSRDSKEMLKKSEEIEISSVNFDIIEEDDGVERINSQENLTGKPSSTNTDVSERDERTSTKTSEQGSSTKMDDIYVSEFPEIQEPPFMMNYAPNEGTPVHFDLDYRKIKKDLYKADNKTRLLLMQALRWRITRTVPPIRDTVITAYVRHDLFDLQNCKCLTDASEHSDMLMERLFCDKQDSDLMQESTARLINTFASLKIGRDYLCQSSLLLPKFLLPVLYGKHPSGVVLNDVSREMVLAILQKMSLRVRQRIEMIQADLTEYLVKFLINNYKTVSVYCLEYSMALLMNLCLHKETKERCKPLAKDLIGLMANLLNVHYQSCLPYVNGTLYSLLSDDFINEEAKKINFEELLEHHIKITDGEMKNQLEYNLKIHRRLLPICECKADVEIEDEVDLLEPELDRGDPVSLGNPSGEDFLYDYQLDLAELSATCFCKPLTPRLLSPSSRTEDVDKLEKKQEAVLTAPILETNEISTAGIETKEQMDQMDGLEKWTRKESEPNPESKQAASSKAKSKGSNKERKRDSSKDKTAASNQKSRKVEPPFYTNVIFQPQDSFCETTKQFYHTPTKQAIFCPQRGREVYCMPPGFFNAPSNSGNCPNSKDVFTTVYRRSYTPSWGYCYQNYMDRCCPARPYYCNRRSRYRCDCYDRINSSNVKEHANNGKEKPEEKSESKPADTTAKTSISSNQSVPSQRCEDSGFATNNDDCDCYKIAFESRPKLARTP